MTTLRHPITPNFHSHTHGYKPHLTNTATHVGSQPHPTATPTRVSPGHTQLPQPHTRAQTTFNCLHHTRGYQSYPTGTTKLDRTNHIQIPPPHTWEANHIQTATPTRVGPDHTQLPQPHTRAQTTSNWHHQTRGQQSHTIATAKYVGTNNHCLTRGHQTHSTVITIYVDANHIQLPPPHA